MYGDNEGPTEVIIPEQRYLSCSGCKYFKHHLMKSGHHPIYANNCTHDTAPSIGGIYRGNLSEGYDNRIEPGDWCPFINNEKETKT